MKYKNPSMFCSGKKQAARIPITVTIIAFIFSLIFLFLYTLVQQVTGFDIEELKYCGILFAVGLIFQIILFLFIRKDEGFNWKNIALYDRINKKCFRINIIMLVIILFGTFIYANIVLNKGGTV